MRVTQHSGRKHRTGKTYSTKHNDRNFSKNADNIDRERTSDNIVWTWCDKFETLEDGSPLHSIDEAELVFYQERYGNQLTATNEKYIKARHKERVKSMDEWRKQVKHAPEEVIIQIGKMNDHPDLDLFTKCFQEYLKELEKWNNAHGNVMHILDWALHQDEIGAPHIHLRRVWDYHNSKTKMFELGQEKALEVAGVTLPHPDKAPGRFNNRKMTFDAEMRIVWQNICKKHGLEIETIPLPKNEVGMSLDQKIRQNEEERNRKNIETEQLLKETEEQKKSLEAEKENFENLKKDENEKIEKTKEELEEKKEEAQKILDRENSVTSREESVKKREKEAERRENEQAEWIEKQKTAHEYLKKHDIDSNYFVLDAEIPELLKPEDSFFITEDREKYTVRNLKNFKKIIDEKIDHFKRKFNSLVNCVKTLLEENKILRKENKLLKEDFDKTVKAKVNVAENKLRFDLTKMHMEEKAELQKKADRWDKFLKGEKTTFIFDEVPYTCQTGAKTIYNVFNELSDYESLTQYGVEMLAKKMKSRGFETVKDARDYAEKHNLESISDISEKSKSSGYGWSN